ncbi:dynamin family protein [Psychrobacillus sp. FSL H8-0510]|uniref:dynamin family protein n=1 Tax=Psychrobacillus sp. FSL H8-0510 TaxID=2921394 RepID=UPI0030F54C09
MSTKVLTNEKFVSILNAVLPDKDPITNLTYFENLKHKISNQQHDEFYIPVLGIQGTGKSSFLNALLMDDYILPVDADETTCVPVEIRYGDEKIVVHFEDKSPITVGNYKEIEQYVHNSYNPGNEKHVKIIQVYKKHELLQNGIVFVDLPGVGSLTPSNVKTTMEYIEKLSAAIFMIRSVPPILKNEANFLKMVWPKLSKAWFVQNQWNDEADTEVEDGKEHNDYILNEIQKSYKMNDSLDIRIINVYGALTGKFTKNQQQIDASGIPAFQRFISEVTSNWRSMINDEKNNLERQAIMDVKEAIQQQIKLYEKGPEEHYEFLREQESVMQEKLEENDKVLRELKRMFRKEERQLVSWIESEIQKHKEDLRATMHRVVKSNVVDGDRLAMAFQDSQKDISDDCMEQYLEKMTNLKLEVQSYYDSILIQQPDGRFVNYEEFNKNQKLKIEKTIPTAISLGIGIGTILLASNPVGWIAGAAIGIIGSIIGSKSKKFVQENRQRSTMSELEPKIQDFARKLENSLKDNLRDFVLHIEETIELITEQQAEMLEKVYEEVREMRFIEIDEYKAKKKALEDDLAFVHSLEG